MTSNAAKATQVGANVIDQSVAWGLEKPPAVVFDVACKLTTRPFTSFKAMLIRARSI